MKDIDKIAETCEQFMLLDDTEQGKKQRIKRIQSAIEKAYKQGFNDCDQQIVAHVKGMESRAAHASEPTTDQRADAIKLSAEIVKQLCEALSVEWRSRNDLLAIVDKLIAPRLARASELVVNKHDNITLPLPAHASEPDDDEISIVEGPVP